MLPKSKLVSEELVFDLGLYWINTGALPLSTRTANRLMFLLSLSAVYGKECRGMNIC